METFAKVAAEASHETPEDTTQRGRGPGRRRRQLRRDRRASSSRARSPASRPRSTRRRGSRSRTPRASRRALPRRRPTESSRHGRTRGPPSRTRSRATRSIPRRSPRIRKEFGAYVKGPAAAWADATKDYLGGGAVALGAIERLARRPLAGLRLPRRFLVRVRRPSVRPGREQGLKQLVATSPGDLGGSTVLDRIREALGVDVGNVGKWLGDVSGYLERHVDHRPRRRPRRHDARPGRLGQEPGPAPAALRARRRRDDRAAGLGPDRLHGDTAGRAGRVRLRAARQEGGRRARTELGRRRARPAEDASPTPARSRPLRTPSPASRRGSTSTSGPSPRCSTSPA